MLHPCNFLGFVDVHPLQAGVKTFFLGADLLSMALAAGRDYGKAFNTCGAGNKSIMRHYCSLCLSSKIVLKFRACAPVLESELPKFVLNHFET
jgi:hypothetical protein